MADQSFPACFPTGGEGECLKILRLEDGTLSDLTSIFLDTVKHFIVPAGSVVLLHSSSHLAWAGPAAYCEDFVRARQRIYLYATLLRETSPHPAPCGAVCSFPLPLSLRLRRRSRWKAVSLRLRSAHVTPAPAVSLRLCRSPMRFGLQPPLLHRELGLRPLTLRLSLRLPPLQRELGPRPLTLRFGLRPPQSTRILAFSLWLGLTVRLWRRDPASPPPTPRS